MSITQDQETVADKVRKLLAKAGDPAATVEEAQAFSAKAQQLMSRHSITLAMISDATNPAEIVCARINVSAKYQARKITLAYQVALLNDCKAVWNKDYAKDSEGRYVRNSNGGYVRSSHLDVVGYANDVEWVKTLCASLDSQLVAALAHDFTHRDGNAHHIAWSNSYIEGYTSAVISRLSGARRAAREEAREAQEAERAEARAAGLVVEDGPSVALVLANKAEKVAEEYKVRFPSTRSVRRSASSSYSGRAAGKAAGNRASLARGSVGGNRKGLR